MEITWNELAKESGFVRSNKRGTWKKVVDTLLRLMEQQGAKSCAVTEISGAMYGDRIATELASRRLIRHSSAAWKISNRRIIDTFTFWVGPK